MRPETAPGRLQKLAARETLRGVAGRAHYSVERDRHERPVMTALDFAGARQRLDGVLKETPLERSDRLSEAAGFPVLLKREDVQRCRSFKVRGAYNAIAAMSEKQRARGVVAASAGNHAQGVAFACNDLGVEGQIFLPSNTPRQKRNRIAEIGGPWVEQVIVDGNFDLASARAQLHAMETRANFVHPFDDPHVIAGQGTTAQEIFEAAGPEGIDTVLVPVGGGGLLAGIAAWFVQNAPQTRVVGVEPAGAASMQAALAAGRPVELDRVDNFVDGTAVARVGNRSYEIVAGLDIPFVTVPEGAVCSELLDLYHADGVIAEPAGALASAALRIGLPFEPKGPVVCVVSGGNNDLSRYDEIAERSARYQGLRHYFMVRFQQQPGALRYFLDEVLGPDDDIVLFEYTKKNNRETGPALVGIELADPRDITALRKRIDASPVHVEEIPGESDLFRLLI